MSRPIVSHAPSGQAVNWSEDLEQLHEEVSRTHCIDVWTRRAIVARLGPVPQRPTVPNVFGTIAVPFGTTPVSARWTRIMTADELRELAASGVEIGAHSMTHRDLTALSYEDARGELLTSKRVLEELLQAPVSVAAYPYGHSSEETRRACRDAGFRFACAAKGLGAWTDPYALPRHGIGNGSTILSLRLKRKPRYHGLMDSRPLSLGRAAVRTWLRLTQRGG